MLTVFMNKKTFEKNKEFFNNYDVQIREYLDDDVILVLDNKELKPFEKN